MWRPWGGGEGDGTEGEDGGLNGVWEGDPKGHLEVELERFCGCQGLFSKRGELGMRPGLQEGEGRGWVRSLFWTLEFVQWSEAKS